MISPAPKPAPSPPKARKVLRAKKWGVSNKPRTAMKKSGQAKAKKVERQRAFYASTVWKRLRKEALERAGHQCEYVLQCAGFTLRCEEDSHTTHLHVHHKTNVRFGGDELPEDLAVYCRVHHDAVELRDHPHRQRARA